jgi:hypothetical protein
MDDEDQIQEATESTEGKFPAWVTFGVAVLWCAAFFGGIAFGIAELAA